MRTLLLVVSVGLLGCASLKPGTDESDAGNEDAGIDASMDSGAEDAGEEDAGMEDSGPPDAGGPPMPMLSEVIFTEFMIHPGGGSGAAQWIELTNISAGELTFDLQGCSIQADTTTIALDATVLLPPDGIVVLASGQVGGAEPDFAFTETLPELSSFRLLCDGNIIDSVALALIAFPNPRGSTSDPGQSIALDANKYTAMENNAGPAWCTPAGSSSPMTYETSNDGSPGATNGTCLAPLGPRTAGELVITEFLVLSADATPAPTMNVGEQWFEVRSTHLSETYDLDGCEIENSDGVHVITGPTFVAPGRYVVFGQSNVQDEIRDYEYSNVVVMDTDGLPDELWIECDLTIIDEVEFESDTWCIEDQDYHGIALHLDDEKENATDNDYVYEENWCFPESPPILYDDFSDTGTLQNGGSPGRSYDCMNMGRIGIDLVYPSCGD